VATENTRFAMPETAIGLFPDVGGGWYLSRLPGRVGQYMALTGARLDGAECLYLGLATHYIPSERLEEIKGRIAEDPSRIEGILGQASATPPEPKITDAIGRINKLYASDVLEEIFEALLSDDSDWAAGEAATLGTKSPQACKVSLRLLEQGALMENFADEMRQEYAVATRVVERHDFIEGVRAVLIDKDNQPKWDPPSPEGVTDAMLDAIFTPLPRDEEWTPFQV
jgi:enoyl-CoA hydratase